MQVRRYASPYPRGLQHFVSVANLVIAGHEVALGHIPGNAMRPHEHIQLALWLLQARPVDLPHIRRYAWPYSCMYSYHNSVNASKTPHLKAHLVCSQATSASLAARLTSAAMLSSTAAYLLQMRDKKSDRLREHVSP